MSVFDKASGNKPSGYFGICNETGDRQSSILQHHRLEDELKTPADRQKKKEIDEILSEAMMGLTFEERQEQQEIIHGVDRKITEEETFIATSLQQMDAQLAQIKRHSAYELAEQMDPLYVRDRAFRVMFLRANRYDAKASADNMIRFFEMKRELFGVKRLVKDITLEDLDEDDIAALRTGFFQFAGKDSSGRYLNVCYPGLRGNTKLQNTIRVRYYMLMSALKDEDYQLSTSVVVIFSVGDMKERFGGKDFFQTARLTAAFPKYNSAIHCCTDETRVYLIQLAILKALPLGMRSRCRLHFGSQTECLYHLKTFGIPQDFLPLDSNTNQISLKRHLEWVESRLAVEKHRHPLLTITPKEQSVINTSDDDVLVGTGGQSKNMGNMRVRSLVKEWSQAYDNGTQKARKELVDFVIKSVHESGGRFLNEHRVNVWSVVWKEMPMGQIRRNVTQAFRNSYRRRKSQCQLIREGSFKEGI